MKITLKTVTGSMYFIDDETLKWFRGVWDRTEWRKDDEGTLVVMPDIKIGERVILCPATGPVRTTDEVVTAMFTKGDRHIT